ncbi:MAG: RHS repeat-associated core domain-containing protein, partial [Candidatus Omnitrophota bacterium]
MKRFISPDTIVQSPYDPQSLNRYAYCRNNPIILVDPTGYSWLSESWRKSGAAKIWNENRYYIITGALILATGGAALSLAPGALQSVLISATIGEIGGAISGGIAANAAGGDVGKGMLFGAIVGGVTGAISEGMFPADKL